jgi:hypothetical protein
MEHPDIKAWLSVYEEHRRLTRRLEKLEKKAAEAWTKTLSPEQLKAFEALELSCIGMTHLRVKMRRRRDEEDENDEEAGFGKRDE